MVMRIKTIREGKDMTQQELATQMAVAQTTVSQWETETALPRARDLPRLATVLACSIDELFEPAAVAG